MVNLTIDGKAVQAPEGSTILEAARSAGFHIPTLCYLKDLNEVGACRVCVVEVEGHERLVASCNRLVEEGMVVNTNTVNVRKTRRMNIKMLLSRHDCKCATCIRNGNCQLQSVAKTYGITDTGFDEHITHVDWPEDFPLIRNEAKCISCMRCIQVCDKIQSIDIWDLTRSGSYAHVDVAKNKDIKNSNCVLCGQCITHCPVGALHERDDTQKILDAIDDPEITTIVQIAPSIRTAWAEEFGVSREFATIKRMVAALRHAGFDYIINTDFSADLTITEEASEFVDRFTRHDQYTWPMFTSCCPGWVRFVKSQYPEFVDNLSTSKSPMEMFGATVKTYYSEMLGLDPKKVFSIAIMPCLAKKAEADYPSMSTIEGYQDVDAVLTNREAIRMVRAQNLVISELPEEEFDQPLGNGSGAGVIFGATGGVMEAALRTASFYINGKNPAPDAFRDVRGLKGWKEATFHVNDSISVRVAVVSGLGNTRALLEALKKGEVSYDFVEVMACPGGCAGGGGQPIHEGEELAGERGQVLYGLDEKMDLRFSHENPAIQRAYKEYFVKPLSSRAEAILHTDQRAWKMPNEK